MWSKVNSIIGKNFNNKLVFNDKYLEIKIKSYQGRITPNVNGKVPKEGSEYICLYFKSDENYFPYTFLEECTYKIKKKEIKFFILMN